MRNHTFVMFSIPLVMLPFQNLSAQKLKSSLRLSDGFQIETFNGERDSTVHLNGQVDRWATYSSLRVLHHGRAVFVGTTDTLDYYLRSDKYPQLFRFRAGLYQLLILFASPPGPDEVRLLGFRKDRLVEDQIIPELLGPLKDLAGDGGKESAGINYLAEEWQAGPHDTTTVTSYNPIIYYKITQDGFVLDSSLTIKENRMIYGKFYGFQIDNDHPIPVAQLGKKLEREFQRITK